MRLIREIMYCKPGKVRPMVDKFLAMSKLNEKLDSRRSWTATTTSLSRGGERFSR
jgi:hypothetical protein